MSSLPPFSADDALASLLADALRHGRPVDDSAFDALLSQTARAKSGGFWSAVEVAQTASRWLSEANATRVLDVGAGVGKWCAVASLTSGHRVWGLEQRGPLVFEARKLAQRLGAEVVMLEGTLESVNASRFDGLYFFNPFAEHIADKYDLYDETITPSLDTYLRDARTVEGWLRAAKLGTAMVTYNGLGGRIPTSWACQKKARLAGHVLRLWVKTREETDREAFVEVQDLLITASMLARLSKEFPQSPLEDLLVSRLVADWQP
ncbi:MAG: hypothetical protein IAE78_20530 [Myxococcus sp.]|nr:hypothetical protein [Myxococcus sp.]